MVLSNRPFARKFKQRNHVLDKIDGDLLKRRHGKFTYGGWCSQRDDMNNVCDGLQSEKFGILKPGTGGRRLKILLKKLVSADTIRKRQCK